MWVLRKWQILRNWRVWIYQRSDKIFNESTKKAFLAKIKTRWQKRHVDNCGLYENDIFCETGEFGKDWHNEITKQAYWQLTIFAKMANLRKWGIDRARIHSWSGMAILRTMTNFAKMANLIAKLTFVRFLPKWAKAIKDEFLNAFALYSKCGQVVISQLFA